MKVDCLPILSSLMIFFPLKRGQVYSYLRSVVIKVGNLAPHSNKKSNKGRQQQHPKHTSKAKQMKSISTLFSSIESSATRSPATAGALSRVAVYKSTSQTHPFQLVISRGSVVDFSYPPNPKKSAIVNAANTGCLGGGGVDGAIGDAGGEALYKDRLALPIYKVSGESNGEIRCRTGEAVITSEKNGNFYGDLNVSHVIHAVGPNYCFCSSDDDIIAGDEALTSAYTSSLDRGKNAKLEAIAFSLLSAGVFRGTKSVKEVLTIGMDAICKYEGYEGLKEVHICAFNQMESDALMDVAEELGLEEASEKEENDDSPMLLERNLHHL